jgi:hypothetical protein
MIDLFNLTVPEDRGRSDIDAYLNLTGQKEPIPFELKSTGSTSISTVRDFGPEHIAKWVDLHWIFAFYKGDANKPSYCYYASPADMADWITDKQNYVLPDYVLAQRTPARITDDDLTAAVGDAAEFSIKDARGIMKLQWNAKQYAEAADLAEGRYSRARMLDILRARCNYVIRRGATLNNPHISEKYFLDHELEQIKEDWSARLRELVAAYFIDRDEKAAKGETVQVTINPIIAAQASAAETEEASE